VDGKEEVVKEGKPNDIVNTIMRAWDGVIESPTKEKFQSFLTMLIVPFWILLRKKIARAW